MDDGIMSMVQESAGSQNVGGFPGKNLDIKYLDGVQLTNSFPE